MSQGTLSECQLAFYLVWEIPICLRLICSYFTITRPSGSAPRRDGPENNFHDFIRTVHGTKKGAGISTLNFLIR